MTVPANRISEGRINSLLELCEDEESDKLFDEEMQYADLGSALHELKVLRASHAECVKALEAARKLADAMETCPTCKGAILMKVAIANARKLME